ncbi:MAG: DMT family transporter [Alicyclobacillus sp.]|nr:DMT family transporter [Alicyclobacillus sp.]
MGIALAICSLVLFSLNTILTKLASATLDVDAGFLISVTSNVVVSLVLFVGQCLLPGSSFHWQWLGAVFFLLAGVFSTYLGRLFYFDVIVKLGPARASVFQVSNPLFTFIIAWVLLGEQLTKLYVVGFFLTLAGLVLISYVPGRQARAEVASSRETPLPPVQPQAGWGMRILTWMLQSGLLLGLFSAVAYAVGNVLRGAAIHRWNEPVFGAWLQAVSGMALHFATSPKARQMGRWWKTADRRGVALYALGGACTIGAQIFVIAAMRFIPVSVATLISLSQPLLVIPMSYFFLKNQEGIRLRTLAGSALVMAGIAIISW